MRKRSLAMWWPLAEPKPKVVEVRPVPEEWNQEEEKHRNQRRVGETPQEMLQRLAPGLDIKRLML